MDVDRYVLERLRLAVLHADLVDGEKRHRGIAERGLRPRRGLDAAAEIDAADFLVAHHLFGRAFGDALADIHGDDPVDEAGDAFHVVVDEEHGAAIVAQFADQIGERFGLLRGEGAIVSAFWNTGQDCTATTRVFVHSSTYQKFVALLIKKANKIRVGNPMSEKTDMGPLISSKQRDRVEEYVKSGVEQGAELACGGARPAALKKGYFYSPTIFTDVSSDMRIAREEIFGPVLCVFKYSTVNDAIKQANNVPYGLAASVWGSNATELFKTVRALKAGTVWVNEHGVLVSEMPHGGYKQSGFGKDLSLYSLEEYTQLKHVYMDQTGAVRKPWYYTVYGDK